MSEKVICAKAKSCQSDCSHKKPHFWEHKCNMDDFICGICIPFSHTKPEKPYISDAEKYAKNTIRRNMRIIDRLQKENNILKTILLDK